MCIRDRLIDAANAFPRIYDAIKNAEHYILIEFFIIKNDSVGPVSYTHLDVYKRQL